MADKLQSIALVDPDEAVLFLFALLPLLSLLVEVIWPRGVVANDFEQGVPSRLCSCVRASDDVHDASALDDMLAERRWEAAKLQAQLAVRQHDAEQNAQALLGAVHALRACSMQGSRAHHAERLGELEELAVAASAALRCVRDERLQSERRRDERRVEERLREAEERESKRQAENAALHAELAEAEAARARLLEDLAYMQAWVRQKEEEDLKLKQAAPPPAPPPAETPETLWAAAAAALESSAPRSVSLSHAELTLVKSSSTSGGSSLLKRGVPQSLSTSMLWRTAKLARIAEAGHGFVLGEGVEAKAVTDALGTALCTLEHSIEEEVCAWDYREWNYVAAMAAHTSTVELNGSVAKALGGAQAGTVLEHDAGHAGMTLKDFCAAPEATRAELSEAEVLALRLLTGRLGLVLQTSLLHSSSSSLARWATTLACAVSATLKLIRTQSKSDGPHAFVPLTDVSAAPPAWPVAAGVLSRAFVWASSDPWTAREALQESGPRAFLLLTGGAAGAADVGWVSQFPQQCSLLLPPGSRLRPKASTAVLPPVAKTRGVRCVEAALEPYSQTIPYSVGFHSQSPTMALTTGSSVPGAAAAIAWACDTFGLSAEQLKAQQSLTLPAGTTLFAEGAGALGTLCARCSREACPNLEEVCLRGARLAPNALRRLVEALTAGAHGSAVVHYTGHELALDLSRFVTSDASEVGELMASLIEKAPSITDLDLGGHPLGTAGLTAIARVLAKNTSLAYLGLAATQLGTDAAKKLGTALRQNGDLLLLDVRHNNLSKEAQRVLIKSSAARPRSSTGDHETLELRLEPNAPLLAAELVAHTPRDHERALTRAATKKASFARAASGWRSGA